MLPKAGNAQPKSGDFLLGGGFSVNQNKDYYMDTSYLSSQTYFSAFFRPQLGIFITKCVAISGFTNIIYNQTISKQRIENSNGVFETNKSGRFVLAWGGSISYYKPIYENMFWVNKLIYDRGYISNGISFASFISKNTKTFEKSYSSTYTLQTGIQYFFKPHLSLSIDINALSFINPKKTYFSLNLLDKYSFLIGLNFLIQSKDE
jgi:hypothetical protein